MLRNLPLAGCRCSALRARTVLQIARIAPTAIAATAARKGHGLCVPYFRRLECRRVSSWAVIRIALENYAAPTNRRRNGSLLMPRVLCVTLPVKARRLGNCRRKKRPRHLGTEAAEAARKLSHTGRRCHLAQMRFCRESFRNDGQ